MGCRHLFEKMSTLHTEVSNALEGASLQKNDAFILACSGGKDSMVLLHVLLELGYKPIVAHVNFQLRGEDSRMDEAFVGDFCAENNLEFHSTQFQTESEATENKESIQMAARRLRYAWLFSLLEELNAQRLLTAHHERDQAETLLLNLMRGTGPQGLQGMVVDDGRLMRPMLRCAYEEIAQYANAKPVAFREDRSNASVKYKRNFIRHTLLSPWEEAYPGTVRQFSRSSEIMQEVNVFLQDQFNQVQQEFVQEKGEETHISFSIKTHTSARLLMRHILKPFALEDQAAFVLETEGRPGAIFKSPSHVLLADRTAWIVRQREPSNKSAEQFTLQIEEDKNSRSFSFGSFDFELKRESPQSWPSNANTILLANHFIDEGCYFRLWQEGDRMQPFGMKGQKKLSDLFIDAKIDRFQKGQWPILCAANGTILWVPGIRSAEQLRLNKLADAAFALEVHPS